MFNSNVTVDTLASLILHTTEVDIYLMHEGRTYRFPNDEIPDEFLYCKVHSIDDPFNANGAQPLCMNIDDEEEFDNIEEIINMFQDYEQ